MLWRAELKASMGLGHSVREAGWVVPVVRTMALSGLGVSELVGAIADFRSWLGLEGRLEARRAAQWRERILEMVRGELLKEIQRSGLSEGELPELALRVVGGVENPYLVVPRLLAGIRGCSGHCLNSSMNFGGLACEALIAFKNSLGSPSPPSLLDDLFNLGTGSRPQKIP